MNKKTLYFLVSAAISVALILWLIKQTVVDKCTAQSGTFNYDLGHCVLTTGEIVKGNSYLLALYFIGAVLLTYFLAKAIQRIFGKIE